MKSLLLPSALAAEQSEDIRALVAAIKEVYRDIISSSIIFIWT